MTRLISSSPSTSLASFVLIVAALATTSSTSPLWAEAAFTVTPSTATASAASTVSFGLSSQTTTRWTPLAANKNDRSMDDMRGPNFPLKGERGVSVDQDGKSNVWAIEPKMEVSAKSSEENMQSAIIAGGGLGLAGLLASVALLNLPDPNQF